MLHTDEVVCCRIRYADKQDVRQRLNLRWGVMPFRLDFGADPEENVDRTFALLKRFASHIFMCSSLLLSALL
jgi:hypothetical protein